MSAVAAAALPEVVAQSSSLTERALVGVARVLGVSVVAAGVAAAVAAAYRWYVRERVPGGLPALFGLSAVVTLLGATNLLQGVIDPTTGPDPLDEAKALANVATVLFALGATRLGTDVGDRLGSDVAVTTGERAVEAEVGRVVQAVGRVISVELPEDVEDIVGYDPVPEETKEALAGKTFVFPRRLTVEELRDRLVTRLTADYAVGHVDLELAADGTVEYLAVGSRAAGIGPTLPPETSAVAVRADPAFAASAGDLVQVWRTAPFERVLTAEVRGTVDDVVTLAIDAADTRKLDAETDYRLVTLPVESRPDREFASVLRAADETMAAVTVADGSALAGQPLGAVDVTVVAVRPAEGPVEPFPARDRRLVPGDALYLVAVPEAIRKVELGANALRSVPGGTTSQATDSGAHLSPDDRVDATTPVAGESPDDPGPAAAESRASDSRSSTGPDRDDARPRDDRPDDSVPGIQTLEDDSNGADEPADPGTDPAEESPAATGETDSGDDQPDDALSREELEDLPGTDVDDLTGTDVTDEEATDDESADEEATDDESADEEATDDQGDDGTDGGGWSVAVDQRREDASR